MGREPSSSPFLSHHHHHHLLPGAVLADHPHLLLLGFPSFAAAASVTLSLASCLSHLRVLSSDVFYTLTLDLYVKLQNNQLAARFTSSKSILPSFLTRSLSLVDGQIRSDKRSWTNYQVSHQFARPTAILLQELLHLLFPTAGSWNTEFVLREEEN